MKWRECADCSSPFLCSDIAMGHVTICQSWWGLRFLTSVIWSHLSFSSFPHTPSLPTTPDTHINPDAFVSMSPALSALASSAHHPVPLQVLMLWLTSMVACVDGKATGIFKYLFFQNVVLHIKYTLIIYSYLLAPFPDPCLFFPTMSMLSLRLFCLFSVTHYSYLGLST